MFRRISDPTAPSMHGAALADVLALAELERPTWSAASKAIPAWHPRAEGAVASDEEIRTDVRRLNKQIAAKSTEAREKWAEVESARDAIAGTPAASDKESDGYKAVIGLHAEYQALVAEQSDMQERRNDLQALLSLDSPAGAPSGGANGPQDGQADHGDPLSPGSAQKLSQKVSAGDLALGSKSYKELAAAGAFQVNERKSVEAVLVPRREGGNRAAADALRSGVSAATLVTGADDTQAGALILPDRQPGIVGIPPRELRLVDMITVGTTDSDTVEFVVQKGGTNNAAEVAEATAIEGTSGTKPLSSIELGKESFNAVTIAHAIAATKRALRDASQVRTLIEQFLTQGLDERLDNQIAGGSGQGENIRGINNTLGIAEVQWRKAATGNTDTPELKFATIYRAIVEVRKARYRPTAIGMTIEDWAEFVLYQTGKQPIDNASGQAGSYGEGNYFLSGGPVDVPNQRLWGLPVIISEAFETGAPIVGDFRKAALWIVEGTQILASDSHEDFFLRNMVAILAELVVCFGVIAPAAFCRADID